MNKSILKLTSGLLSLLLTAAVLIQLPISAAFAADIDDFRDVDKKEWYYDAVKRVVERGIFSGTSASAFSPKAQVTRGMFVQLLANYTKNYEYMQPTKYYFDDISKNSWYEISANWAYEYGLVSGVGDREFGGDYTITREQAATILFSYAMRTGSQTGITTGTYAGFQDAGYVSDWAHAAMRWAVEYKIMTGTGANKLEPKGYLTRAQAAQLLVNMDNVTGGEPEILPRGGIDNDPEDAFILALGSRYGELVQNTENPRGYDKNDSYQNGYLFDFDDCSQARYIFNESSIQGIYPRDDAKPDGLITRVKYVLPQISGMTFGAAVKRTEGRLDIYYEDYGRPYTWFRGEYTTEHYHYYILLSGTEAVSEEDRVVVRTCTCV